jgi:hypothetical protein
MTAGTMALLALVGGGVVGVATLTGRDSGTVAAGDPAAEPDPGLARLEESPEVVSRAAAAAEPLPRRHTAVPPAPPRTAATTSGAERLSQARVDDERADRTGPRPSRTPGKQPAERAAPQKAPARTQAAEPVVTTRTDVETREIPYDTQVIRDPSLPRGTRTVESPGADGEETLRYLVTLTDGRPTARILVGREVTREPEPRIVVFGARRAWERDCVGPLRVCMPLGRSAVCPEDGSGETVPPAGKLSEKPAAKPAGKPGGKPVEAPAGKPVERASGVSVILTEAEVRLLDPKTLDAVRLEPAAMCR